MHISHLSLIPLSSRPYRWLCIKWENFGCLHKCFENNYTPKHKLIRTKQQESGLGSGETTPWRLRNQTASFLISPFPYPWLLPCNESDIGDTCHLINILPKDLPCQPTFCSSHSLGQPTSLDPVHSWQGNPRSRLWDHALPLLLDKRAKVSLAASKKMWLQKVKQSFIFLLISTSKATCKTWLCMKAQIRIN